MHGEPQSRRNMRIKNAIELNQNVYVVKRSVIIVNLMRHIRRNRQQLTCLQL